MFNIECYDWYVPVNVKFDIWWLCTITLKDVYKMDNSGTSFWVAVVS